MNKCFLSLVTLIALSACFADVQAQDRKLTQSVDPSFRIEPMVHRYRARRGEVIPFEFTIGSLGKEMDVIVQPVNLRQEESGIILHDQASDPAKAIRMSTPKEFKLTPGQQQTIGGKLTVPIARSNYLSYGLLVREVGKGPDFNAAGDQPVKAGIRFVTQYVLRVDVETGITDVSSMSEMEIKQGVLTHCFEHLHLRFISDQGTVD